MISVNEYYDGNVLSISFKTKDEIPATVGVMAKGEYEFTTSSVEVMTVTSGKLTVKLPNEDWKEFEAGETFTVGKGRTFNVKVDHETSYLCLYK